MAVPPWSRLRLPSQPILMAGAFAILVVMSVASIWLVNQSSEQSRLVAQTLDAQNKLSQLLLEVRRTETAQRGYLLTGQAEHLEEYRTGLEAIAPSLEELGRAMADNPEQQRALAALAPSVRGKLREMAEAVRLRESNATAQALALVRGGSGRLFMNDIRERVNGMLAAEHRLFEQRTRRAATTDVLLLAITLVGAMLIVALAALSILLVRRSILARDEAQRALEETNVNLEQTIGERTADLREANEEIQRFAYIVSHDLRSPLVNIMGFTTELEALRKDVFGLLAAMRERLGEAADAETALGQDFDEAIAFIKTSISKMDRLINAILKLSREGGREFRPEPIAMTEMLESIAASLAHQANEAGATITISPLPELTSDRLALEQVFSNLLDNALKYLRPDEPGRIAVEGRTTRTHAVYEVRDNGRGVDPKDHQRIFELFRRSGLQDRPGEGIGLAHVRALVRRIGGNLSVQSELGSGSVFTVTLPRRWVVQPERKVA